LRGQPKPRKIQRKNGKEPKGEAGDQKLGKKKWGGKLSRSGADERGGSVSEKWAQGTNSS